MSKKKISPTYFSEESVMGGGERYAWELAKAMANDADVTFLSFGKQDNEFTKNNVRFVIRRPYGFVAGSILNPYPRGVLKLIRENEIVHVHQIFTVLTEISILLSRIFNKRVYVTDHGGGGRTFLMRWGILKWANALLCVSNYSVSQLEHLHPKRKVIWGGVDLDEFTSEKNIKREGIVTCGRILPHKGFHNLINALDEESLTIIGRKSDLAYYENLKKLAFKKDVTFVHDADDSLMKKIIQNARLAVFPSTNTNVEGDIINGQPELLGIAPLECMALNTPTLVSNIGAYPEIAFDEGYIFQHNDKEDLKSKIKRCQEIKVDDDQFRNHVKTMFTWELTAKRCLAIYSEN